MTPQPAAELLGSPAAIDMAAAHVHADPQPDPAQDAAPALLAIGLAQTPSDEHLLARFLKGDREALGLLASRHEPQLLGLACALTGRRDLALESVQDTWLKVIKYGRSFKSGSTVKTWLYRILINACKDTRAKNARFRLSPAATGSSLPVHAATDVPGSKLDDPPDLSIVRSAVDQLTGDQRLLILLCYHNGLTHPQAAQVLDIPLGTLKSRLNTILNALRSRMQEVTQ